MRGGHRLLHLPLSAETKNIIDAKRIAAMKQGAVLINCARGGLVDEAALSETLKTGRLMGAGIDAYSQESPVGNPLLTLDNAASGRRHARQYRERGGAFGRKRQSRAPRRDASARR